MKHHPDLFDARAMRNDTRLLFKLKLILGSVCAYGGEVPLTRKELARRLATSVYRVNLLIRKLMEEELVSENQDGTLFLRKFVFVSGRDGESDSLYAKFFNFFVCEEFIQEERNVQRFVLHYVGKELVYIPGNWRWGRVSDLCGDEGMLSARCVKEAAAVIDKAGKYLHIKKHKESFHVTGVRSKWIAMGETFSQGAVLWVRKHLDARRFCMEFISKEAVEQMAKVMEYYYAEFGYEFSSKIFAAALSSLQQNRRSALSFHKLIYREDGDYVVSEEKNELNEISAYFRAVMKQAELELAQESTREIGALSEQAKTLEMSLGEENPRGRVHETLIRLKERKRLREEELLLIHRVWIQQFRKNPAWFIGNSLIIERLQYPFIEIKRYIREQINGGSGEKMTS